MVFDLQIPMCKEKGLLSPANPLWGGQYIKVLLKWTGVLTMKEWIINNLIVH